MSAVFQEVTIQWGGETYRITPTMGVIQRIEQEVSISSLTNGIINGEPQYSHMAIVLAYLIQAAGGSVDRGDIYAELWHAESTDYVLEVAETIVRAFIPEKKSDSQGSGAEAVTEHS